MNTLIRCFVALGALLGLIVIGFVLWVYATTYHPSETESATLHCPSTTPEFDAQQPLSLLSYNVQFFAGTNSVFYYDLPNNEGPDLRPERADIDATLDGIAELLVEHNADVVLLQEVHDNAAATDQRNQLAELLERLPRGMYPCYSETFYWQADYVPHPKIMGSVGMKLVTLSKYKLSNATRHRLPQPPMDWVSAQFYLKRAILVTDLAQTGKQPPIRLLNTHFDAFAQGSDTMDKQVSIAHGLLTELENTHTPWVFAGDLNLLLPGERSTLKDSQHYLYNTRTELMPLLSWPHLPNAQHMRLNKSRWLTHRPNDPDVDAPDRVIDYLMYSPSWRIERSEVLNQGKALSLSDHFAVTATLRLKNQSRKH